jgi:glycosyltransferase involved in cell wall biosynthesis
MPERLLIVDSLTTGHHLRYIAWVAQAGLDKGFEVCISLVDKKHEVLLAKFMDISQDRVSLYFIKFKETKIKSVLGLVINDLLRYRVLKRSIKIAKPDQVFLPYIDRYLWMIGFFGLSKKISGITMRTSYHHPPIFCSQKLSIRGKIREFLISRLLQKETVIKLYTIDPVYQDYLYQKNFKGSHKIQYIADPFEVFKGKACEPYKWPKNKKRILVYGVISNRKGIDVLLELFEDAVFRTEYCVVIAGLQDRSIEEMLNEKKIDGIIIENKFIDFDLEDELFNSCDLVWVYYSGHVGMSGVLIQAASKGKPVIGSPQGLIEWFITTYKLGTVITSGNKEQVSEIRESFSQEKYIEFSQNGRELSSLHSLEIFKKKLWVAW